ATPFTIDGSTCTGTGSAKTCAISVTVNMTSAGHPARFVPRAPPAARWRCRTVLGPYYESGTTTPTQPQQDPRSNACRLGRPAPRMECDDPDGVGTTGPGGHQEAPAARCQERDRLG